MKNIEIDEELYQYIASNTQFIGESASSILRRLTGFPAADIALESSIDNSDIIVETSTPDADDTKVAIVVAQATDEILAPIAELKEPTSVTPIIEDVLNYINKEELAMQRGAVGRFLLILAALYRVHTEGFSVVSEIRGRDRLYFATSKDELSASGSSTKPLQIPDSPFWVMTNSNTTRKKMMLTKASLALGYSDIDAEQIRDLL
ncbi:MAG: replication initiation negative regulator SeqA [Colwellia sp.]|nr:replication initiation negative regulator SeqA [Colwellia sp.]